MDILDIDEALKDDSYIFLADKTHDDISNILQQWKTNNQQQLQLQPQPQSPQQQQHYNNEQAYKLNSKTFTRPKRRSQAATNLETQFTRLSQAQNSTSTNTKNTGSPMVSLEIGGLVTNMHRSFLQDTSPPSSIYSSMNNERMNNSLISSADFTNLNFLQSTNSLEPGMELGADLTELNLTTTLTADGGGGGAGYTLSDMIRDRKALESLTMSGDGTLIKDSHIAQIDDISLATLSKTASGCSTMDNSTDSVSTPNELQLLQELRPTMLLSEEMIGDTTFSLVDSLTTPTTTESIGETAANATFKRPTAPLLNETLLLTGRQVNTTYTEAGYDTPETTRCETPENVDKTLSGLQMESTPLTTTASTRLQHYKNNNNNHNNNNNNNNNNKLSYTPTLKGRGEIINISPIISTTTPQRSRPLLNHTYEPPTELVQELQLQEATFAPGQNTMELLEQIEQPPLDATYNMSEERKQMQCILDLAEAEVELLTQQGDEEQFEHMLDELGKANALNAEQIKMQKSLDSIKRRFHKDEEQPLKLELQQHQQQLDQVLPETPPSNQQSIHSHSQSQSSGSGERLLSRRSRLYDDVNLSAMHDSNASGMSGLSAGSSNSTSFIVHRREEQTSSEVCSPLQEEQEQHPDPSSYKLTERRERDRERFKTIKITKEMRARDDQLENHIVVPCIDDEPADQPVEEQSAEQPQRQESPPGRMSRRDQTAEPGTSSNYLTYKKPKEKSLLVRQRLPQAYEQEQFPEQQVQQELPAAAARSLSRPRYISGLQKFTTVSKATSAGAGLNATTTGATIATATAPATGSGELKSPMGIKSKSFHNLSSNISGISMPRPSLGGGLRRPSAQAGKFMGGLRGSQQQQEDEQSLFKVPKLVSGLRAPTAAGGAKRAVGNGLARPSSGYYSLSMKPAGESETPESLSSASSRGSLYGKDTRPNHSFDTQVLSSKLTQVTTGSSGIPKPSGLRQPTQMKRSGLPRPSSIVRR